MLKGKVAIVTGSTSGIGLGIAKELATLGADLVLNGLGDAGEIEAIRSGIERERGVRVIHDGADMSKERAVRGLIARTVEKFGRLDILVNNAGILRFSPLLDIPVEDWDLMFAINTRPMLVTTQVAARRMIEDGVAGTIINLASMAGKSGGAGQAHYAASKAAVIALTRVTALELGCHGITANCLCPGYVLTEMGADTRTPEDIALWSSYSPLGRLGEPGDVSAVAAFLASPDAAYLTGQAFNVTGGMVMH